MKLADTVIYTNAYGTPSTESAAIVTGVNADGTLNLACFYLNEIFFRLGVPQGNPGQKDTWHPKP